MVPGMNCPMDDEAKHAGLPLHYKFRGLCSMVILSLSTVVLPPHTLGPVLSHRGARPVPCSSHIDRFAKCIAPPANSAQLLTL